MLDNIVDIFGYLFLFIIFSLCSYFIIAFIYFFYKGFKESFNEEMKKVKEK